MTSSTTSTHRLLLLLKPLRDAADAWNVDLSAELGDVLERIEDELNFVQAGIMVQNSSMVYAKKVESLFESVILALNKMTLVNYAANSREEAYAEIAANSSRLFEEEEEEEGGFFLGRKRASQGAENVGVVLKQTDRSNARVGMAPRPPFEIAGKRTDGVFQMTLSMFVDFESGALQVDRGVRAMLPAGEEEERAEEHVVMDVQIADERVHLPSNLNGTGADDDDGEYDTGGGDADNFDGELGDATSSGHGLAPPPPPPFDPGNDFYDPHMPCATKKDKPFKKGKTYVAARSRFDQDDETFGLKTDEPDPLSGETNSSLMFMMFNSKRRNQIELKALPLNDLAFPEFESTRKERRKLKSRADAAQAAAKVPTMPALASIVNTEEFFHDASGTAEENFDNGEYDAGGGGDYFESADDNVEGDFESENNSSGVLFDERVVEQVPATYAELVQAHVAKFMENAKNWANESKLTSRVRMWHDYLEPILAEQENRPSFDLRESENRLIEQFDSLNDVKSFDALVTRSAVAEKQFNRFRAEPMESTGESEEVCWQGEQQAVAKWQVCRVFLATLQLAATGSVYIVSESQDPNKESETESEFENRTGPGFLVELQSTNVATSARLGSEENSIKIEKSGKGNKSQLPHRKKLILQDTTNHV